MIAEEVKELVKAILAEKFPPGRKPSGNLYAEVVDGAFRGLLEFVMERNRLNVTQTAQSLSVCRQFVQRSVARLGLPNSKQHHAAVLRHLLKGSRLASATHP